MAKSKSTSAAERLPQEPELAAKLNKVRDQFWQTVCTLTCALETLSAAQDEGEWSEDAARAVSVMRQVKGSFEDMDDHFDGLLLRIAHEGIPAKYAKAGKGKEAKT